MLRPETNAQTGQKQSIIFMMHLTHWDWEHRAQV